MDRGRKFNKIESHQTAPVITLFFLFHLGRILKDSLSLWSTITKNYIPRALLTRVHAFIILITVNSVHFIHFFFGGEVQSNEILLI